MILRFLIIVVFFWSCSDSNKVKTARTKSGLEYAILKMGDNSKVIHQNDFVNIDYKLEHKGRVLDQNKILIKYKGQDKNGGINEGLSMMTLGSEFLFIVGSKAFYNDFIQTDLPDSLKEATLNLTLFISELYDADEYLLRKLKYEKWLNGELKPEIPEAEKKKIEGFVARNEFHGNRLPNGIIYKEVKSGSGNKYAQYGSRVLLHYKGMRLDGSEFDSSYKRDFPLDFNFGQEMQVIKGFEQIIPMMSVGAVFETIIPSYLAFGKKGSSNQIISPNSPLYYRLELIAVN